MARVLYDGLVEYEDGTPATSSQMAKDVVEFLNWSAEPEMDQRKKMGLATIVITSTLLGLSIWVKRYVIRRCDFLPVPGFKLTHAMWRKGTNGRPSRPEKSSITPLSTTTLASSRKKEPSLTHISITPCIKRLSYSSMNWYQGGHSDWVCKYA